MIPGDSEVSARVPALWKRKEKNSPAADIIDYYLAPKQPEHRCPMAAHGEEVARMEEGCELRGVYAEGAKTLFETFMDAAKASSMAKDQAPTAVRGYDRRQHARPSH